MLQYLGTRQPPRKYTIQDLQTVTTPPKNSCDLCRARVWSPEHFSRLSQAPVELETVALSYGISSKELRKSALGGCEFCRTIADGIHGRVFLDELYERLRDGNSRSEDTGSSDYESDADGEGDSEGDTGEEQVAWDSASAFNEEDMGEDISGGWDTWQDRDTLLEPCDFKIELMFERGEDATFTFLNVRLEAVGKYSSSANALQTLHGEKMVELRYQVNAQGSRIPLKLPNIQRKAYRRQIMMVHTCKIYLHNRQ